MSRVADVEVHPRPAESPAEALRSASRQRNQEAHVRRARSGFSLASPAPPLCTDSVASGAEGGRNLGAPVGAWGPGNPGICSSLQQYYRVAGAKCRGHSLAWSPAAALPGRTPSDWLVPRSWPDRLRRVWVDSTGQGRSRPQDAAVWASQQLPELPVDEGVAQTPPPT